VADALGSTGNYLAQHGWQRGMTWGYEVVLPPKFDIAPHDPKTMRTFPQWASLGIRRADGMAMPTGGEGALLLPAGVRGPAFVVTANYRVIRAYNNSAAYMLGVALLSDRIAGAGPLSGRWPTEDKPLSTNQAMDIQRHLQRLGYPVGKLDGRIGEQAAAAAGVGHARLAEKLLSVRSAGPGGAACSAGLARHGTERCAAAAGVQPAVHTVHIVCPVAEVHAAYTTTGEGVVGEQRAAAAAVGAGVIAGDRLCAITDPCPTGSASAARLRVERPAAATTVAPGIAADDCI
jgi:hypothetical protein